MLATKKHYTRLSQGNEAAQVNKRVNKEVNKKPAALLYRAEVPKIDVKESHSFSARVNERM